MIGSFDKKRSEYLDKVIFKCDHFYQGSKNEPIKSLREKFPDFKGICWFACLVMAYQALNPKKNQVEAINDLKLIFDISKSEMINIFSKMREEGIDTSPFWKKGQLTFIDSNQGVLKSKMAIENPEAFCEL
ncbi:MAG: hypothetical protein ACPL3E_00400, partial [Minisyncoccia bacterium]